MTAPFVLPYEPRPRDFTARFGRRRVRTLGAKRQPSLKGRSAMALLAAVAVPAIAAPDDWSAFDIGNAGQAEVTVEPMPFEKPGSSFPGSAFYYLAADTAVPAPEQEISLQAGIHSDAIGAPSFVDPVAGPAARAMRVDNSGIDRTRALQCLTAAVYYEARSEPDTGQRAVAQVVLNRVAHPSYPNTVCGVVFQGSERTTGCQFSFTCDGSMARVPDRMFWLRAENVARAALAGYVHAPVGLATHYHTIAIYPYWAPKLSFLGVIGYHRFYRFSGAAGQPGAFRFAYYGGEPMAGPHPRSAAASAVPEAVFDPVSLQRAYEQGQKTAQAEAVTAVAPVATGLAQVRAVAPPTYSKELQARGGDSLYRGDKLPQNNGIKPEFQNSGRWITRPGT